MSSSDCYKHIINNHHKRRNKSFEKMASEGYIFGEVVSFDNSKGMGMAEDVEGNRFLLHYKNMDRVNYKILSKGQRIHFKPGVFNTSVVACDIAIVY